MFWGVIYPIPLSLIFSSTKPNDNCTEDGLQKVLLFFPAAKCLWLKQWASTHTLTSAFIHDTDVHALLICVSCIYVWYKYTCIVIWQLCWLWDHLGYSLGLARAPRLARLKLVAGCCIRICSLNRWHRLGSKVWHHQHCKRTIRPLYFQTIALCSTGQNDDVQWNASRTQPYSVADSQVLLASTPGRPGLNAASCAQPGNGPGERAVFVLLSTACQSCSRHG